MDIKATIKTIVDEHMEEIKRCPSDMEFIRNRMSIAVSEGYAACAMENLKTLTRIRRDGES
jgi:hypothetical protein